MYQREKYILENLNNGKLKKCLHFEEKIPTAELKEIVFLLHGIALMK